ncbi:hypothetical protein [Pasteurella multocida]|uniref:hypothetical protein n=1 Tax=Pasteurella multocida TaxID=747 RepID=UPI0020207D7E|nr:hypothetical protein [Pasteurella multocida]MCL7820928.1 hypothetical protein [Pasteurella multocida]HDR1105186.1 hypothetical protein [Pasteurella multocida]
MAEEDKKSNQTGGTNPSLEGHSVSDYETRSLNVAALNRQISEGFNLKVANQSPPPRPTTQPVSHKKK